MIKLLLSALLMIIASNYIVAQTPSNDAKLTKVSITFTTHNDNKDHDTRLNVTISTKINLFLSKDVASGSDVGGDTEFVDPSTHTYDLTLNSSEIKVADLVAPFVSIDIQPKGNDRWIFDYVAKLTFSDGNTYSTKSQGVILDQNNKHYSGVFAN